MPLFRALGALPFVLGVTLLAFDGARSLKLGFFDITTVARFWSEMDGDKLFPLRHQLSLWMGSGADQILELPAAFLAFGIGLALLLIGGGREARKDHYKPLTF